MDFLNTAYGQLSDLFRSMTIGARITAGLLLVVVVVSLAWLFQHQVSGGDAFLLAGHSFSSGDLVAAQAAFSKAGLNDFEVAGTQIRIPRHQQYAYIAALADDKALPADWNRFLTQSLDSNNPFMSASERETRLRVATQEKLSLVLKAMNDVADAAVQYDSQKKAGLHQERVATASVMIKMKGSRSLNEEQVQMIREMVAGCFAGLKPEKVIVSDLGGRVYAATDEGGLGGVGGNHKYLATKAAAQKHYQDGILKVLAYVPGVMVAVNVELEKDLHTSTRSVKHDPKTTTTEVHETSKTVRSETAPRGGPPGLGAQQPQPPNQPARVTDVARGSTNEEESSSRDERNVVNTESTERQEIGLTPRRVTVSVGVPSSYFEDVWRAQNPAPPGQAPQPPDAKTLANIEKQEIERIQSAVVPLIPKPTNELDPTPLVTVTKFTTIAQPEIPGPSAATTALSWFGDQWQTLGLIGLVLISLLIVRSMVRTAPGPARALDLPLPAVSQATMEEAAPKPAATGETAKARLKRKVSGGKSLRDELTDMVREDPDTAAAVLRGWIGSGN